MSKELHINTILAQAGIKSDEATGALVTPLHFSTTYQHPEFGRSTGFDYTRTKNPTRSKAEEVLAAIESADYALATSSGMAAIVPAFSVFPVGSKVLAVRDLYGGSFRWFNQVVFILPMPIQKQSWLLSWKMMWMFSISKRLPIR